MSHVLTLCGLDYHFSPMLTFKCLEYHVLFFKPLQTRQSYIISDIIIYIIYYITIYINLLIPRVGLSYVFLLTLHELE